MRWTIVCGGPAGQGPNFISNIIAKLLLQKGFYVFNSREYESRIRGGHNYNIITFSENSIMSNSPDVDLLIALDALAESQHVKELKKNALVINNVPNNAFALGAACKILEIDFSALDSILNSSEHYQENFQQAKKGYETEGRSIKLPLPKKNDYYLQNGNEAVALGAIESGLDLYYAYPMTPATGVLFELAQAESKNNYTTVEMESEIAVVNAAIGSAMTGAKTMAGTSGGGFDLMTEALTLSGIGEIPLMLYLAQRPGPATGAATYTAQGDLAMARHAGHGEFSRVVAAPGNPVEAAELTSQFFYLSQKYKIPAILLSDKHLADSFFSMTNKPKITQSKKSIVWPARFSSYESRENRIATGEVHWINKNVEARLAKAKKLTREVEKMDSFKVYGKKSSKNIVIGWGSTQGAIVDAIEGLDCKFLQVLYLEPFSAKITAELSKAKSIILVENNSTAQLSSLIAEKTGIIIPEKNKILKYDGRPFMAEPLAKEISRRLK
jgi:2-oxoglutarate ferredoxin oxidoreductase subunit alpha